jgi:hypothetical protein
VADGEGDVADVAADAPQPASTALTTTAPTIHLLLLVESTRRTLDRRACLAKVSGGSDAASASLEFAATGGPDVTLDVG